MERGAVGPGALGVGLGRGVRGRGSILLRVCVSRRRRGSGGSGWIAGRARRIGRRGGG